MAEGRHRRGTRAPGTSCATPAPRCRAAASSARRCPTARNSMTSLVFIGFIHRRGRRRSSRPTCRSPSTATQLRNALEFYKSMRELCPPGATNYSLGRKPDGLRLGRDGDRHLHRPRARQRARRRTRRIADSITCAAYPTISADVAPWTFNDFPSRVDPEAQSKNMDAAKKFAAHLFRAGRLHQAAARRAGPRAAGAARRSARTRSTRTTTSSRSTAREVDLMAAAAAGGYNLG